MGIFESLACWCRWLAHSLGQTILDAGEFVLGAIFALVNAAFALLPADPVGDASPPSGMLGTLNYFVPMGAIVGQFSLLMAAWILYKVYQWIIRWAKAEG